MKIEVCVCEFWSVLWQVYMCGMGKQAVHEPEPGPEVNPRVTAVAHKRPQSFCQNCRWQVTAKYIHAPYACGFA